MLTKSDLVENGAELSVVDLVEGRSRQMRLGWHIIRGLGQKELQRKALNRGELETFLFLSEVPWSAIDNHRAGIVPLGLRRHETLSAPVKITLPKASA